MALTSLLTACIAPAAAPPASSPAATSTIAAHASTASASPAGLPFYVSASEVLSDTCRRRGEVEAGRGSDFPPLSDCRRRRHHGRTHSAPKFATIVVGGVVDASRMIVPATLTRAPELFTSVS